MDKENLVVLWTSGDREKALKMVFMYSKNAKLRGWWKNVIIIIWGPSAELAVKDAEIHQALKEIQEAGVVLQACKACSDMYGTSADLEKLGVDVQYIGETFTDYLKREYTVITV